MTNEAIRSQLEVVVKTAMVEAYRSTNDKGFAYWHGMTAITMFLKEIGVSKEDAKELMSDILDMMEEANVL